MKLKNWFEQWVAQRTERRGNAVDLRHFSLTSYTDAWDGKTTCSDGWSVYLTLYKGRVVVENAVLKAYGSTESRSSSGSHFWEDMAAVASAYMRIMRIARTKFFGEAPPQHDALDRVWIGPEIKKILIAHPQYQKAVGELGIVLEPDQEHWRVSVSKRAEKE